MQTNECNEEMLRGEERELPASTIWECHRASLHNLGGLHMVAD